MVSVSCRDSPYEGADAKKQRRAAEGLSRVWTQMDADRTRNERELLFVLPPTAPLGSTTMQIMQ